MQAKRRYSKTTRCSARSSVIVKPFKVIQGHCMRLPILRVASHDPLSPTSHAVPLADIGGQSLSADYRPLPPFHFPNPGQGYPSHPSSLFSFPSAFPPYHFPSSHHPPSPQKQVPSSQRVWGSAVSSPSKVWGGITPEIDFGAFSLYNLTSGGNKFIAFPENQIIIFRALRNFQIVNLLQ